LLVFKASIAKPFSAFSWSTYGKYGEPIIYLCTEHEGEPKASKEIRHPDFFPMDEFEPEELDLFPPFAESLKFLDNNDEKSFTKGDHCARIRSNNLQKADGGPGSGRYPKGSGEISESEHIGFGDGFTAKSRKAHLFKRQKNGHYKNLTEEQYNDRALSLLSQPLSDTILGGKDKNGNIVRYNTVTGDYAVGVPGKKVLTMYPLRGGVDRYNKLKMREKIEGGS
jgi:hypothetical protein